MSEFTNKIYMVRDDSMTKAEREAWEPFEVDADELDKLFRSRTSKRLCHKKGTSFMVPIPNNAGIEISCASVGDAALIEYLFNHAPGILRALREDYRRGVDNELSRHNNYPAGQEMGL